MTTSVLLLLAAQEIEHTRDPLDDVRRAVEKKEAVLLDVREKREWEAGHLEAARFLPMSRLLTAGAEELEKLLPKGSVVYPHCRSGARSLSAARILRKLGYDVRPLKPGFEELREAGFREASK